MPILAPPIAWPEPHRAAPVGCEGYPPDASPLETPRPCPMKTERKERRQSVPLPLPLRATMLKLLRLP